MIIHQILHGYDEGHRLLAGSTVLENQSAKFITALSDLGCQGGNPPTVGYVTGYPVSAMKMYAIARTWLAPEMPRPGCVWTHTLLIDFSDLASINDLSVLSLFRRPVYPVDTSSYNLPLLLEPLNTNSCQNVTQEQILPVMEALYKSPGESVYVYAEDSFPVTEVAMAVWLQQWPKLRRSFRFCTWVPYDRSQNSDKFDLQFVPMQRHNIANHNRSNPGIRIDINNKPSNKLFEQWALTAINNNTSYSENSLREFLWRYGAESDEGRAAFIPLVMVWKALGSKQTDYEAVVPLLKPLKSISSLLKQIILGIAKTVVDEALIPSNPTISFVINNLALLNGQIDDIEMEMIAKALWQSSPHYIWTLFRSNLIFEVKIATFAALLMQPKEALDGTKEDPELFGYVIKSNERLAASPLIWNASAPIPQIAAGFISRDQQSATRVLPAMFESDNQAVANIAIDIFGKSAINMAIKNFSDDKESVRRKAAGWLFAARHAPEYLSQAMIDGDVHHTDVLELLSTFLNYHAKPLIPKVDEWACALRSSHVLSDNLSFSLSTFLISRALCGVSPEPDVLIVHSFDSLHSCLLESEINYKAWGMLEPLLPEVSVWDRWDKGYILRLGIVNTFVRRQLPPNEFMNVTRDLKTYKMLVKAAATSQEGRNYLVNLASWANNRTENYLLNCGEIAKKALRKKNSNKADWWQ